MTVVDTIADERDRDTVCLFGEGGDLEVLGAHTLEGFGLAVDPIQRRLVPAILFGASEGSEVMPAVRAAAAKENVAVAGKPAA